MPNKSEPWESLQPGEQWRGEFDTGVEGPIGPGNEGAALPPVPVMAARGRRDGPRVAIFGAVHGDEYEGPAAIHALYADLQPETLDAVAGLIIGIPVANRAAWLARTRTTPQDGLDLNRCFPGKADPAASPTERLAHSLFNTFVAPADVIVDLHSGGVRLVHLPMIGWGAGGDPRAEALARIFGFDFYPWQVGASPGILTHEATHAGKIALGAEWGGGGNLDPAGAGAYAEGLRRILGALSPAAPWSSYESDTRPPLQGGYAATPVAGLFHPAVALGQHIEAETVLGTVVDEWGREQATLTSERAGIVAGLAHLGRLEVNDRFVYIG